MSFLHRTGVWLGLVEDDDHAFDDGELDEAFALGRPRSPRPSAPEPSRPGASRLADSRLADSRLGDSRLADSRLGDSRLGLADPRLADARRGDQTGGRDLRLTDHDRPRSDERLRSEERLRSDERLLADDEPIVRPAPRRGRGEPDLRLVRGSFAESPPGSPIGLPTGSPIGLPIGSPTGEQRRVPDPPRPRSERARDERSWEEPPTARSVEAVGSTVLSVPAPENLVNAPQTNLSERATLEGERGRRHEMTMLHPTTYSEARAIGEHFRQGYPVMMNLAQMADADAKRLVDFAAGLAFGLRGGIERVTNRVFLLTPPNVWVSEEEKARALGTGRP